MTTTVQQPMHYAPVEFRQRIGQTLMALLCVGFVISAVVFVSYRSGSSVSPTSLVLATTTPHDVLPNENAVWKAVELPWRICQVSQAPCYEHLRVPVHVLDIANEKPLVLYLPGFRGAIRVTINGIPVTQIGRLTPPIESILFRPTLVPLAPNLLHTGDNELIISVGADRGNFLRVNPFYIGPASQLEPVWRTAKWLSVDLLVASTGIYVVLGFLALLTFRLARENVLFPWFAAIAFCAAARNSFFLWTDPHFDLFRSVIYFQASLGQLAAVVGFTGALVGIGRNRSYLVVAAATLPIVLVFALLIVWDNYEGSHFATMTSQVMACAAGVWALVMLGKYQFSGWHFVKPWVFILFLAAFVLALHDIAPSILPVHVDFQLSNMAPLFLVMAFCFILAHQFSSALAQVQAHNQELQHAVSNREAALHDAYADIRRAEQEQAVGSERVRILQDVHDGVGGRLAGLVLLARRRGDEEMAAHIQESLSDLRLIIDSLDDDLTDDLADALTLFRSRAESLLAGQSVTSSWQLDIPEGVSTTPNWMVNVLRALQEALHNVIKHAHANHVEISATLEGALVTLRVEDDGIGMPDLIAAFEAGRGLPNLQRRIEGLQGTLSLTSEAGATRVVFEVPLPERPHESGGIDIA